MGNYSKAYPTMKSIISRNIRIRHPKFFTVGEDSIIDDYCYFSTRVTIGKYCHIASGCSVAGGVAREFILGDFSSLSSGVKVWCSTNDFTNDLVIIFRPEWTHFKHSSISGDVIFDRFTGVGANSVIMPNNHIPEGTVIGAMSFTPSHYPFKPWSVYAGIPIAFLKHRNRENVMKQFKQIETYNGKQNKEVI